MKLLQDKVKAIEDGVVQKNQDIIIATEQIGYSKDRVEHFTNEISVKEEQARIIDIDIKEKEKIVDELTPKINEKNIEFNRLKDENSKWIFVKKKEIVIHQNILINYIKYKKIILGKNGMMIKKIRQHSQKQLCNFFDKKVHLASEF